MRAGRGRSGAPQVEAGQSSEANDGVTIRRRPPYGQERHDVGGVFEFRIENVEEDGKYVANEENQPRNILEEIVWSKDVEVSSRKDHLPLHLLKNQLMVAPPVRSFPGALRAMKAATGMPALIAEVKKASPSKGVIQPNFNPVDIAVGYERGGAACCSVLTDEKYFQGSFDNLKLIRSAGVKCPLLCKEFIVEAYQLFLARAKGADAVLLIAAVLPNQDLKYLMKVAKSIGLSCLIEVHTEAELERVLQLEDVEMLGVNNRNLETFEVDLHTTGRLLEGHLGDEVRARDIIMVGESGIYSQEDVEYLNSVGCSAILVGESLVKQDTTDVAVEKLFGKKLPEIGSVM